MKLGSIQMLRAVAAILVVYTHSVCSMDAFGFCRQQFLPPRTAAGTLGVDLFFVVSGFVIYLSAGRLIGGKAARSFLWHRFRRINPVYYAATLLTVLIWAPTIVQHRASAIPGIRILASITLLRLPQWPTMILFQAWTLSYEWYFYGIFFLLIILGIQKKPRAFAFLLSGLFVLGWLLQDLETAQPSYCMDPILFEFLLGMIIGYAYDRWTPGKLMAWGMLLPGILLGVFWVATGYFDFHDPHLQTPFIDSLHALFILRLHALCWGPSAALIVAGCVFLEKHAASPFFHRHRLILLLGDASYSIYLFHMIPIGAMAAVYLRVGFFWNPNLAIISHCIIAVAGSLLFYYWVERPLLRLFLKNRRPRPIPSPPVAS